MIQAVLLAAASGGNRNTWIESKLVGAGAGLAACALSDQSSISSKASNPFFTSALLSPWRTKHMVTKLSPTKKAA